MSGCSPTSTDRRVGHLRRRRGPLPTAAAADADAVLISHLHADHLHLTSLPRVAPRAKIDRRAAPPG